MAEDDDKPRINPGYILKQRLKALANNGERAAFRALQWQLVLEGVLDGVLRIGSSTPVEKAPQWVTLEVLHGGFATGEFAAAGALLEHERERLAALGDTGVETNRGALNLYFIGDDGRSELEEMLGSARFRLIVPEEGALLIAAWLLKRGEGGRAAELVQTIAPFFYRLRFYPAPRVRPRRSSTNVFVQTTGEVATTLRATKPKPSVERMNEAVRVWTPLAGRAVALFLETVEGSVPSLQRYESGALVRAENGQPIVTGGWPCRRYPADWSNRARWLLEDYRHAREHHPLCGKPDKPKENFARLRGYLEQCVWDSPSLTGRDVGMIRKILASVVTRYGVPGAEGFLAKRASQERSVEKSLHPTLAGVLADRLASFPEDEGVADLEEILSPLSSAEAEAIGGRPGEPIPASLCEKTERCLEAPMAVLVERGLLSSNEAMARVLPALTAKVRAEAIEDPELRQVYEAVYVAFRRRRSLLLLDLESQAKLDELPWIAAVAPWVRSDDAAREAARKTLVQTVRLNFEAFPQTIVPNKLVKELRVLAHGAGLALPIVDELAADIFMGAFSEVYLQAAKAAARLLSGTIYEHYYGLPYDRVLALDDIETRFGTSTSPGVFAICSELARATEGDAWSVARNGTILEQAQVVTTHNLAVLFVGVDLARHVEPASLARRTFEWICRRQQIRILDFRATMRMIKTTAYAWRQMIFYLSLLDVAAVRIFVDWAAAHLAEQSDAFRARFQPVLSGLQAITTGESFALDGTHAASGGRRFLGWSVGRHWLLEE